MTAIGESAESGEVVRIASTVRPAEPLPADWDPFAATVV
jgi:hypothetical protein